MTTLDKLTIRICESRHLVNSSMNHVKKKHQYCSVPQEDLSNKSRQCAEVEKQNAMLHQQMDEMASRSTQIEEQQLLQLHQSFSEEEKSAEQLLEILR